MSTDAPTSRELDALRDEGDRFIADLDEEYYLHFAGLKETLDVEQVYERYEELTRLDTAQRLGGRADRAVAVRVRGLPRQPDARTPGSAPPPSRRRSRRRSTARRSRTGCSASRSSNEPDRDKRRAARAGTRPPARRAPEPGLPRGARDRPRRGRRQLGAPNYYELYKRFGFRLDELAERVPRAARRDRALWETRGRPALPRRGSASASRDAGPWDVARLFRAPELDQIYPNDAMLPALEATLGDLGIDLRSQANVHLDVDVPPEQVAARVLRADRGTGQVMLVIQPIGGKDDWEALFHEAGHTEHFANTSADAPFEARRLGDMAVTEGWAMLLRASRHRARVAEPPPRRARGVGAARTTARSRCSTSSAATRRSCSTRSSSSRPTNLTTMRSATSSCSATRSSCRSTRRATSTTSTAAST